MFIFGLIEILLVVDAISIVLCSLTHDRIGVVRDPLPLFLIVLETASNGPGSRYYSILSPDTTVMFVIHPKYNIISQIQGYD